MKIFRLVGMALIAILMNSNLTSCSKDNAAVFVFHGIPERVHPHCNVTEKTFRYMLDYLKENDYTVLSMKDYAIQKNLLK